MSPRIGVAAIVQNLNGEMLLSVRKSEHGNGVYAFPGGHLELGENIIECARRELEEESSLVGLGGQIIGFTEDIFSDTKHYITFFVRFEKFEGVAQIMEPNKSYEWNWYGEDSLPQPLFLPIIHLQQKYGKIRNL